MTDPRTPDRSNTDPAYEDRLHKRPPLTDPAADPQYVDPILADQPANARGRGGMIAAAIIAVLVVIAVIAFSSGTVTDPETTAVIPPVENEQTQTPAQTPTQPNEAVPAQPDVPVETAPATPAPQ